ncbi:MAG TPA: hypothetical protein VIG72_09040 [Pontibacter sp.]
MQTRASNRASATAIVESYSFIVTDQERTGRDLSLRVYNREQGDATIASLMNYSLAIELITVFGLSAFDLLRCRRQSDAGG